jgi:hypothetical protein
MTNNNGRMRANNNRRRTNPLPQVTALKREITGFEFTPAMDPTTIVERPYNQICLEFTNLGTNGKPSTNSQSITVEKVLENLSATVGLTGSIRFKVQRATAYVTSIGPDFLKPTLRFATYELRQASSATARINLSDSGDLNTPAKAGYNWPMVDKKEVLTSADNATLITSLLGPLSVTGTDPPVNGYASQLVRLYILWR